MFTKESIKRIAQSVDLEVPEASDYERLQEDIHSWNDTIQGHLRNLHGIYLKQIEKATNEYFEAVFPNKGYTDDHEREFIEQLVDEFSLIRSSPMEFSTREIVDLAENII